MLLLLDVARANSKVNPYLHGSARWADKRDIKAASLLNNDGVYVGAWRDKGGRRCAELGLIDCGSGWERPSIGQPLAKDRLLATGRLHTAPVLQGQSRRNAGDLRRAGPYAGRFEG